MTTTTETAGRVKPARPAHKPARRTATLLRDGGHITLNLTEEFVRTVKVTYYHLSAVPADFGAAFELEKFSCEKDPGTYHVHIDATLGDSCDCKGFVAHRHCKHLGAVRELVRRGLLKPAALATPASAAPVASEWDDL
jgi:hypothetical protein